MALRRILLVAGAKGSGGAVVGAEVNKGADEVEGGLDGVEVGLV